MFDKTVSVSIDTLWASAVCPILLPKRTSPHLAGRKHEGRPFDVSLPHWSTTAFFWRRRLLDHIEIRENSRNSVDISIQICSSDRENSVRSPCKTCTKETVSS